MAYKPTYENATLVIPEGTLVVLSGLPGSGKSTLRQQLEESGAKGVTWLSSDDIRDAISPPITVLVDGEVKLDRNEAANQEVFAIMRLRVQAGLRMGRTVVVDATNLNDTERSDWIAIAEDVGAPSIVVILDVDVETCVERATNRAYYVNPNRIREMHQPEVVVPKHIKEKAQQSGKTLNPTLPEGFVRTSRFNYHVMAESDRLKFTLKELPPGKWDVVTDPHGLYEDFIALVLKNGWVVKDDVLQPHPAGRKLLVLGDLVDRGTRSLDLVRLLKRAVEAGLAIVVKGNHDVKVCKFVKTALKEGIESWTSMANAETGMQFLKLDPVERDSLINFLWSLPAYLVDEYSKTVFLHANLDTFVAGVTIPEIAVYGSSGWKPIDTDALYEERYARGINEYTLIRGHIPQISVQPHAFSLERHAFQKGELVLLQFDKVQEVLRSSIDAQERINAFNRALITQQCDFDFDNYRKKYALGIGMEKLAESKHVFKSTDPSGMLRVYKYSKSSFYDKAWGVSPLMMKARGIVLDPAGNIVSHPFDKTFNYLLDDNAGADLPMDLRVVVPEKLNGFLGIISAHPLKKNELLVHTQGSFEGKFVDYIKDHITPAMNGKMLKFFASNNVTLMFEVIHASDPHIVEYPESMQGLHLLGVRGKNLEDLAWTEEQTDEAAAQMGLRRPGWSRMTLGEAREKLRTSTGEGFMIRADTPTQEFLVKMKGPYYLTTKFLGRMSQNKAKHMFGNPENFKKLVDEEFFVVVDAILATYTQEAYLSMTDEARVSAVRALIGEITG